MGIEDCDVGECLSSVQARKLLSYVLRVGKVRFSSHARDEMLRDRRTVLDAMNVLRAGQIYEVGERIKGTWRYRFHTQRFAVVIAFQSVDIGVVVTFWEKK